MPAILSFYPALPYSVTMDRGGSVRTALPPATGVLPTAAQSSLRLVRNVSNVVTEEIGLEGDRRLDVVIGAVQQDHGHGLVVRMLVCWSADFRALRLAT